MSAGERRLDRERSAWDKAHAIGYREGAEKEREHSKFWEREAHLLRQENEALWRAINDARESLGAPDTSLPLVTPQDGPPDSPAALDAAARKPVGESHEP